MIRRNLFWPYEGKFYCSSKMSHLNRIYSGFLTGFCWFWNVKKTNIHQNAVHRWRNVAISSAYDLFSFSSILNASWTSSSTNRQKRILRCTKTISLCSASRVTSLVFFASCISWCHCHQLLRPLNRFTNLCDHCIHSVWQWERFTVIHKVLVILCSCNINKIALHNCCSVSTFFFSAVAAAALVISKSTQKVFNCFTSYNVVAAMIQQRRKKKQQDLRKSNRTFDSSFPMHLE